MEKVKRSGESELKMYAADRLVDVVKHVNGAGVGREDIVALMPDGNGSFVVVYWA